MGENGTARCATKCHGTDLNGGLSGVSCNACHKNYPHSYIPPPGWKSGTVHGPAALADIGDCKVCHGLGLDQVPDGYQSCLDCHPSYRRHNSAEFSSVDWNTDPAAGHGRYVLDPPVGGDLTECRLCHGSDFLGGISGKSCEACHPSFPYQHRDADGNIDPNWGLQTGHGSNLYFNLADPTDHPNNPIGATHLRRGECSLCHGANLASSGGGSGVSCQSCHPNAATDPMDVFSCSICHRGAHPMYIPGRVSCLACHTGIDPAHEAGQTKCTKCHKQHTWMPPVTP